jgi:hypothetical protein
MATPSITSSKPDATTLPQSAAKTPKPAAELSAPVARQLATTARTDLEAAIPMLLAAIRHGSGQSAKLARILWSCWLIPKPSPYALNWSASTFVSPPNSPPRPGNRAGNFLRVG